MKSFILEWRDDYISDLADVELRLLPREASLLLGLVKISIFEVLHDMVVHCAIWLFCWQR